MAQTGELSGQIVMMIDERPHLRMIRVPNRAGEAVEGLGPLVVLGLMLAGVSALIAKLVPSRRLVWVLVGWSLAPAILMALTLLLANLLSPARDSTGSNATFAIMLIGSFIVVPWFIVCVIGFAIGGAMRRKSPPVEQSAPEPPAPAPVPALATATALPRVAPAASAPPQHFLSADAPPAHFSHASPDGGIRIDIDPSELGPNQWVHRPRVVETATGRILLDLLDGDWQADTAFPREGYVWLGLRRYHSPGYLFAEFDLAAGVYRIALQSLDTPNEEGPIGDISERLEAWWQRATALAIANAPAPELPPKPNPFAAWRTALVILGGAIIAIAGLTWLSMETGIEPPRIPILRPGGYGTHPPG
jgi:hypothetical protein